MQRSLPPIVDEWEDEWKADLKDVLFNIERGKPIRMINPPVLGFGNSLYPDDAWQIYLAHLGHSLWLEAHGVLPWSLKDMEPEHLKYLLSSEYMMKYDAITISGVLNKCYLIKCKDGKEGITAAVWDPRITYYFMVNDILRDGNYTKGKLLHNTQEDTIYALADWLRAYSQHNLPNQSNKSLYDYNKSAIDRILYPIEGKKCTIITCSGVTAVFRAVLRTVNIPVSSLTIDLVGDAHSDGGTHSTPGFPSIGKQLLNGDDIFDYTLKPTGNTNPVSTLFFSDIQMQDLFENPELDCLEEKCHTIIAQRSYNHAKYLRSLAYNYQVDGILYYYVNYGEDYLDKFLAGPYDIETNKVNNELYLLPYFSKEERKIMIDNTKSWVLQLGEGDFQKGKERIKDRFYHNN